MDQYQEMFDNHVMGKTEFAFGALNHIGISATLAQSGIFGLLLILVFPIYLFLNFKDISPEDKLIKEIFILDFFYL